MKADFSELQLRQLDESLNQWRNAGLPQRPAAGWVRAIREALGMPSKDFAARLDVAPSTVTRLESAEAEDAITLASLRRAAEALDCELQYALVPRKPLADTLDARALELAAEQMRAVSHSMALEAQATSAATVQLQTRALADALLKGPRRVLWKQERKV